MDSRVEAMIVIGAFLLLTGGIVIWIAIIYWNVKIKKIMKRTENILDYVETEEKQRKL